MSSSSPLGGPIATAFVEVSANTRTADAQIDSFIRSLSRIDRAAERSGEGIENAFTEAAGQSKASLESIGQLSLFEDVALEAERAGENIQDAFAEAGRQSDEELREIGGPGTFTGVTNQARVAGNSIERSFDDASSGSLRHLRSLALGVGIFAAGLAAATAVAVGFGVTQAATLEQTQIGFESLLGSAQEAQSFIEEMQRFAATTPFEFQGLANNARQLLAVGQAAGFTKDDIIPLLTVFGDLTATLGATPDSIDRVIRAFGQMSSRGKVSTEELLQLAEALPGFPVFQALADGLGVTTTELQDLLQKGAIPAKEGIAALVTGMKEFPGAAGAMVKQSQTLLGLFSTFKDTISLALTDAFQPLIPAIKTALTDATPAIEEGLNAIAPAMAGLAELVLTGLVNAIEVLGPPLGELFEGLNEGFNSLAGSGGPALQLIGAALSAMGELFVSLVDLLSPLLTLFGDLIDTLLPPLVTILGSVFDALQPVAEALAELGSEVLDALAPALEELAPLLAQLSGAIGDAFLAFIEEIGPDLPDLAKDFGDLAVALAELLVAVTPILVPLAKLAAIGARLQIEGIARPIRLLTSAIELLTGPIGTLSSFLGDLIEEHLVPLKDQIIDGVQAAFDSLLNDVLIPLGNFLAGTFMAAIDGIVVGLSFLWNDILVPLGNFLSGAFNVAVDALGVALNGIAIAVGFLVGVLRGLLELIVGPIVTVLGAVLQPILETLGFLINDVLLEAVGNLVDAFQTFIDQAVAPIAEFLGSILSPVLEKLSELFTTIRTEAIEPLVGTLQDALAFALTTINDLFTRLQEILAPIAAFISDVFSSAWQILGDIWRDTISPFLSVLVDLFGRLMEALAPVGEFIGSILLPVLKILGAVLAAPLIVTLVTLVALLAGGLLAAIAAVTGVIIFLTAVFNIAADAAGVLWRNVLEPFADFLTAVFAVAVDAAIVQVRILGAIVRTVASFFLFWWHNVLEPLVNFLGGVYGAAIRTAISTLQGLASIVSNIRGLFAALRSIASAVAEFFRGTFAAGIRGAAAAFGPLLGAIGGVLSALSSIISLAGRVKDAIESIPSPASFLGGGLIGGLLAGARGMVIDQPTVLLAGEAGKEVLLPVNDTNRAMQLLIESGLLNKLPSTTSTAALGGGTTSSAVGDSVVFEAGAIQINFATTPSPSEATMTGNRVGSAIADTLERRSIRVAARTA